MGIFLEDEKPGLRATIAQAVQAANAIALARFVVEAYLGGAPFDSGRALYALHYCASIPTKAGRQWASAQTMTSRRRSALDIYRRRTFPRPVKRLSGDWIEQAREFVSRDACQEAILARIDEGHFVIPEISDALARAASRNRSAREAERARLFEERQRQERAEREARLARDTARAQERARQRRMAEDRQRRLAAANNPEPPAPAPVPANRWDLDMDGEGTDFSESVADLGDRFTSLELD